MRLLVADSVVKRNDNSVIIKNHQMWSLFALTQVCWLVGLMSTNSQHVCVLLCFALVSVLQFSIIPFWDDYIIVALFRSPVLLCVLILRFRLYFIIVEWNNWWRSFRGSPSPSNFTGCFWLNCRYVLQHYLQPIASYLYVFPLPNAIAKFYLPRRLAPVETINVPSPIPDT